MKASQLVVGKFYTVSMLPSEKLQYRGLVLERMEKYVGDHIFFNVEPYGRIPGCILNAAQVESNISEIEEGEHS